MSCMYVLWDVIGKPVYATSTARTRLTDSRNLPSDDTIARKVNTSDASAYAEICGCCPSKGTVHALS